MLFAAAGCACARGGGSGDKASSPVAAPATAATTVATADAQNPGPLAATATVLDTDPSAYLGKPVTLRGTARNAHSGAVIVLSDGATVYLDNLDGWDSTWNKQAIVAHGTLVEEKLAPDPTTNERGEVSAGMYGKALVLTGATWKLAQP
jgi:hypothetical protein